MTSPWIYFLIKLHKHKRPSFPPTENATQRSQIPIYYSRPERWQMDFMDPASLSSYGIQVLHEDIMAYLLGISTFVFWLMFRILSIFRIRTMEEHISNRSSLPILHSPILEVIWTMVPIIILLAIALPSFALLYSLEENLDSEFTLKVIGNQWYWKYEYSDYHFNEKVLSQGPSIEAYMLRATDIMDINDNYVSLSPKFWRFYKGATDLRMLETDNRVILPSFTRIRILVTRSDVIHSWAVPALGIKCDGVPGRLNQAHLYIPLLGVFYGQCSELCGVNHRRMPIHVKSVLAGLTQEKPQPSERWPMRDVKAFLSLPLGDKLFYFRTLCAFELITQNLSRTDNILIALILYIFTP